MGELRTKQCIILLRASVPQIATKKPSDSYPSMFKSLVETKHHFLNDKQPCLPFIGRSSLIFKSVIELFLC